MASRYALLLCLALACYTAVSVRADADDDFDALDKAGREKALLAAQSETNFQAATEGVVARFASTKKNKSPPSGGGGGGGGGKISVGSGGNFKKVQDAINAAGPGDTIIINGGDYYEKVVVPSSKKGLKLVGQGNPRIYYDRSAKQAGSTAKSASFSVFADGFSASGITFENTWGWPNGRKDSQAVAFYADGNVYISGCTFLGHQDTLFAYAGSQTYSNCKIVGSVDFIFGNAKAKFQSCQIQAISNSQNRYTSVAAQKRTGSENTGFAIIGGSVSGTGNTWLGRLWGKTCTIIYSGTSISGANPKGWSTMSESGYTSTARVGGVNIGGTGDWVSWALPESKAASELSKLT